MNDNQKKWIYVIAVIVIPLICVHLFHRSPLPRFLSLIWLFSALPITLFYVVITTNTVHLKNNSNPVIEKRFRTVLKIIVSLLGVWCIYSFSLPVWLGGFNAYILHQPFETLDASVSSVSSPAVLATGLYLSISLASNSSTNYIYWLPTIYEFGKSRYRIVVVPGTNLILDMEPQ
jgi:hypothetical protein